MGAWVENFDPTQAGSSEKFKPDTSTGDNGWREDHSISLYTPEALAWFAYKVNTAPTEVITGGDSDVTFDAAHVSLGRTSKIDFLGEKYGGSGERVRHHRGREVRERARLGSH